ncbi:MAG: hypothetical protein NWE77_08670 [Candidatus Bathyarchaeota archaeon]|jgi:hypothetical protein|nr:hypothetical protein [Candidatus Bathyarchaeota archaeon]UCC27556.1 MAG: hypothetical protein JSW29_05640 [Candidatus Bathyarchaeota archaeon]UCD39944.1 MAG: hypothetical protein JSV87_05955 [Candidatus Bathyarchaeota archaeon]
MSDRIKMLTTFAILGFFAGMIANFSYKYVLPWLSQIVLPVLGLDWIFSGFAGAALTLLLMTAWAYLSGPSEA